jgi:hypothetical protein
MSTLLAAAYHEASHALVARALGRPLQTVAISVDGGVTRTSEPLAGSGSNEELERMAVILFSGQAGETYAPKLPAVAVNAEENGHASLDAFTAGLIATTGTTDGPSDASVLEQIGEKIGPEAMERARALAVELVDRNHVVGQLERVADELLWRGELSGDDVEVLLDAA